VTRPVDVGARASRQAATHAVKALQEADRVRLRLIRRERRQPSGCLAGPANEQRRALAAQISASCRRPGAASSVGISIRIGYRLETSETGPCRNSAPLKASACRLRGLLELEAASRAIDRVGPRPIVTRLSAVARLGRAGAPVERRRGSEPLGQALESGGRTVSSAHAATRRKSALSEAMTVLVAATLSSGPAEIGSTMSQAAAAGCPPRSPSPPFGPAAFARGGELDEVVAAPGLRHGQEKLTAQRQAAA
jgi:hypothetical protein